MTAAVQLTRKSYTTTAVNKQYDETKQVGSNQEQPTAQTLLFTNTAYMSAQVCELYKWTGKSNNLEYWAQELQKTAFNI